VTLTVAVGVAGAGEASRKTANASGRQPWHPSRNRGQRSGHVMIVPLTSTSIPTRQQPAAGGMDSRRDHAAPAPPASLRDEGRRDGDRDRRQAPPAGARDGGDRGRYSGRDDQRDRGREGDTEKERYRGERQEARPIDHRGRGGGAPPSRNGPAGHDDRSRDIRSKDAGGRDRRREKTRTGGRDSKRVRDRG
jgi:hypothetical protein